MSILAIDLGGTKLAIAMFSEDGVILTDERTPLEKMKGGEVGSLITSQVKKLLETQKAKSDEIISIGISVPGISHQKEGVVWAPNIPGWEKYPLLEQIKQVAENVPVIIDSDRACCIMGEVWKGAAKGCRDAVFVAVGTGIGAGILVGGTVLRGANDIAGSIGWMALERPFQKKYIECGCFESRASGDGMAKLTREILMNTNDYNGSLKNKLPEQITAYDIFQAYEDNDRIAIEVIVQCIELWGMATANLVSIFNPEKIIMGGGVFGPGVKFIELIRAEATRWAQPVSMRNISIEASVLGNRAGLYGAGLLALQNKPSK